MTNPLIEELQAGPGSRELSDKVLLALGWKFFRNGGWRNAGGSDVVAYTRPDCSHNLQDAVDLVTDGSRWAVGVPFENPPFANVQGREPGPPGTYTAPTPALALCIALIKARSL